MWARKESQSDSLFWYCIDFNNEISMKSHIYAFTFGDKDNKILSNM